MVQKHLIFVYGSLKRGHWNHRYLETSRFVGTAETMRKMHLRQGSFPYLVDTGRRAANHRPVAGEVYEVDDATLRRLDQLEGVPHHYQRRYVCVSLDAPDVLPIVLVPYAYVVTDPRAGHEDAPVDDRGRFCWVGYADPEEEDTPDVNDGEDYARRGTLP